MKLNLIPCILVLAVSLLIAFGFYSWCRCEENNILVAVFGGVSIMLALGATFGATFQDSRKSVNVNVLSGLNACALLVSNIVFCCISSFSVAAYVIVNGILFVMWLAMVYGVVKASV